MVKSKRKLNNDEETSPRRCSRRLNELQEDGTPVRRSTRLRNGSNRSKSPENKSARKKLVVKSKRKLNDDEETSPRRCSRRLNELQEDGTPVRRSTRLCNGSNRSKSPENKSARKN